MTKGKAITKFCIIAVIVLLGIAACFPNFGLSYLGVKTIPFTDQVYKGFIGEIQERLGIDLNGGVMAVFDVESKEGGTATADEVNATIRRLENVLTSEGFVEATIVMQETVDGRKQIRVEVPGLEEVDQIFDAIGRPQTLDFRDSNQAVCVEAQHISKVAIYQNPETAEWGILLTFTRDGGIAFRNMVQNNDTTYIYLGDELYSTVSVTDKEAGTNNTAVVTLGKRADGSMPTRADAEAFKLQIESGLYEVTLKDGEFSRVDETLGSGALLTGIIALAIAFIFIFIFMVVMYGDLGLLSNLSIMVFMILFLWALAVVPGVQLTLPGVAGIVLSLGMAVDANIIIFERIKDEHRTGKRLAVSVQNGFNKSIMTIVDSNVTTIIGAVILFLLGTGPIKGFGITLLLGVVISMFCSLIITRSFAKLYLFINRTNAKRFRFKNTTPIEEIDVNAPAPKPQKRSLNLGEKAVKGGSL